MGNKGKKGIFYKKFVGSRWNQSAARVCFANTADYECGPHMWENIICFTYMEFVLILCIWNTLRGGMSPVHTLKVLQGQTESHRLRP